MKLDYGDTVRLRSIDLTAKYGIESGSVCGFREITQPEVARQLRVSVGTVLVLVEGPSGVAVEIPEELLERI